MRTKHRTHPGSIGLTSLVCVCLLAGCFSGCTGPNNGGDIFADIVEPFIPPDPSQVAREAFNVYDADKRRRSVALISASHFGHEEPYVRMYRLLIDDQDPTVRAACAHALGIHGTTQDAALLTPLLNDPTGFVRWETAKALQKIHHGDAVGPLIRAVGDDEDADVRLSAAAALGQYPKKPVFNALVGALSDHNFGVVQTAAVSLSLLTGQDLGTDGGDWLDWADDHRSDLFAQQRRYTYMPYQKPPGKFQKFKFWDEPTQAYPQPPVGLDQTQADDAPDSDV